MRILFGSEFYSPSVGGVQEVVRQLAERMVLRGHDVTVATTALPSRQSDTLNGVKIKGFRISGNLAHGINGKVAEYRRFVESQAFDVILIKAAQQWTFDALWPVLADIRARKTFIPCGFSGLYEPVYADYFARLPNILHQFDHLIFYASDYRDINFAKRQGITKYSIIPNGASELEFSTEPDASFRQRHDIASDDLLFLTVGSLGKMKGHLDVAKAFLAADLANHPATLILNGNEGEHIAFTSRLEVMARKAREYHRMMNDIYRTEGIPSACKYVVHGLLNKADVRLGRYAASNYDVHIPTFRGELQKVIEDIYAQGGGKRVLLTDFSRPELIQAYMNADLFVFASHVEYSPLVLFESAAAGTPFLSVPVGNAAEIAEWTGAGVICPAPQDERGYTKVDPKLFGELWAHLASDRMQLRRMGQTGRRNWAERFTWESITDRYESIFRKVITHA
ncbi:MAG: glycosyltransferase family 4 protein [Nitrospira sp.]|nr:glycosyltransferase family 4 protein [Nitrospira sp.]MDH4302476.1 glycosyltransferase family 4 protein [Nitrospira sp.]MDH5192238.1 glycosyltransferase family 4 protein [Nitrospira sp.]